MQTLQNGQISKPIWVTRPAKEAAITASTLTHAGHHALVAPMLEIVPTASAASLPPTAAAFLITSANSVAALAALAPAADVPLLTIGQASTRAALEAGFTNVTNTAQGHLANSHTMAQYIAQHHTRADGPMVHLSGQHTSGTLASLLQQQGFDYQQLTLYHARAVAFTPPPVAAALDAQQLGAVLFYSARTATATLDALRASNHLHHTAQLHAICLSAHVAEAAAQVSWRSTVVMQGTTPQDLLAAVAKLGYKTSH